MPAPPDDFLIRKARREDVPALAAVAAEFYAFLATIDGSDPTFDVNRAAMKLDQAGFRERPLFTALIAESNDQPIGYAIYNIGFWADTLEGMVFVSDLFVREPWRGRGIGKQFMGRLAEVGQEAGCTQIMWTVWSRNEAAQRFYRTIGAVAVEDEILMSFPIRG